MLERVDKTGIIAFLPKYRNKTVILENPRAFSATIKGASCSTENSCFKTPDKIAMGYKESTKAGGIRYKKSFMEKVPEKDETG